MDPRLYSGEILWDNQGFRLNSFCLAKTCIRALFRRRRLSVSYTRYLCFFLQYLALSVIVFD